MIFDGGSETDFRRMRQSRGMDAAHGYRPHTRKSGPVTSTSYAPIRESDVPGLLALVTDGKYGVMPTDQQEIDDLKTYLKEKYS